MPKEVKARINTDRLLQEAGWCFFDDKHGNANIELENNVKITQTNLDGFGTVYKGWEVSFAS